jgi:hypothetical protein
VTEATVVTAAPEANVAKAVVTVADAETTVEVAVAKGAVTGEATVPRETTTDKCRTP